MVTQLLGQHAPQRGGVAHELAVQQHRALALGRVGPPRARRQRLVAHQAQRRHRHLPRREPRPERPARRTLRLGPERRAQEIAQAPGLARPRAAPDHPSEP